MKRIIALLMFASCGALLTMIILPPIPIYRIYTHQQHATRHRGFEPSNKHRHMNLENEPIIGHSTPNNAAAQRERAEFQTQIEREYKS